jgi:hypothetical protein
MKKFALIFIMLLFSTYANAQCLDETMCPDCGTLENADLSSSATTFYTGDGQHLVCEYEEGFEFHYRCFETAADARTWHEYAKKDSDTGPPPFCEGDICDLYGTDPVKCSCDSKNSICSCWGGYFLDGNIAGSINASVEKPGVTKADVFDRIDQLLPCAKRLGTGGEEDLVQMRFALDGRPIRHLVVHDRQGTKTTDTQGMVEVDASSDEVEIELTHYDDKVSYFINNDADSNDPFKIRLKISEEQIQGIEVFLGDDKKIEHPSVKPALTDFTLQDYVSLQDPDLGHKKYALVIFFYNYLFFQDALEFYEGLGVDFSMPAHVILDAAQSSYNDQRIFIDHYHIDPATKPWRKKHAFAPYVQYHEFSHFAMHTMYGATWDQMITEKNHGGYANPTTKDSWLEGFAHFMAVVIANEMEHYWADIPSGKNPALYPMCGSLDADYKAWEKEGKAEEFAMAGVLWDLIDEDRVDEDFLTVADYFLATYFRHADQNHNEDGVITKEEFALQRLCFGQSIDWPDMVRAGSNISEFIGVSADMSIYEKYKGDDDSLSVKELVDMADEITPYEDKFNRERFAVATWLDFYDKDQDKSISAAEAEDLLRGHEVVNMISKGKDGLSHEEVKALVSEEQIIKDAYWEAYGLEEIEENRIQYEIDELVDKFLANGTNPEDDDNIHVAFPDLWDVMKNRHKDFTSLVTGLGSILSAGQVAAANDVLIAHGIFIDTTEGNRRYDKDVEAFIDTNNDGIRQKNETFIDYPGIWLADEYESGKWPFIGIPSNYERPERQSTPEFAGHYVKGAKEAHYLVWERGKLRDAYSIQTKNGYVPVPPGTEVYAVNGDEMHSFSSTEFERNYSEIKSRGYIAELGEAANEDDTDDDSEESTPDDDQDGGDDDGDGDGGSSGGGCFLKSMR